MVRMSRRIAGERDPAERTDALAEQRPQERLGEDRNFEGALDARADRLAADQVAVVEHDRPALLELEHRFDVHADRARARRPSAARVRAPARRRTSAGV